MFQRPVSIVLAEFLQQLPETLHNSLFFPHHQETRTLRKDKTWRERRAGELRPQLTTRKNKTKAALEDINNDNCMRAMSSCFCEYARRHDAKIRDTWRRTHDNLFDDVYLVQWKREKKKNEGGPSRRNASPPIPQRSLFINK